jgi:hypothetical protein
VLENCLLVEKSDVDERQLDVLAAFGSDENLAIYRPRLVGARRIILGKQGDGQGKRERPIEPQYRPLHGKLKFSGVGTVEQFVGMLPGMERA